MQLDKITHALAGGYISLLTLMLFSEVLGFTAQHSFLAGIVVAFVAGVAKEVFDLIDNRIAVEHGRQPQHDVDLRDLWATTLGGLATMLFLFAVNSAMKS